MKKLLLPLFFLLILFAVFYSLQVRKVEIDKSASCINEKIIVELKGKNLLLINSNKIKEEIKNQSPCIKEIAIKKIFPQKLRLTIDTQKEVAKIENSSLAITENGLVITQTDPNLPTIYSGKSVGITQGQTVSDPDLLQGLKISGILSKSDFNAQSIRVVDGDIAFYDVNGLIVLFSKSQDPKIQVDSLQQVLAKTKIDASKIAKIDLRFMQPVVLFK